MSSTSFLRLGAAALMAALSLAACSSTTPTPAASSAATAQALSVHGTTYATEIPADSRLLSWDEPVSAQPEAVQAALAASTKTPGKTT